MSKNVVYIDKKIGFKIRYYRNLFGISQKYLADKCGISFQQFQKYEVGISRVSAARLFKIATVLEIPIDLFFVGLPDYLPATKPNVLESFGDVDILEMIKNYSGLESPAKKAVLNLLNTLK